LADTHGIAKYARTYIRKCTHTHIKKWGKVGEQKGKRKRQGGVSKERRERKKDRTKRKKGGGKEGQERKRGWSKVLGR